jgi:hypothetical protein
MPLLAPGPNILFGNNEKVDPLFESKIRTILKRPDGNGLLQIYRQYLKEKGYNFLLVVDQFENLFFSTILSQEEKHQFVQLLLHSSLEARQLYVLVALRPPKADLWKTNFSELNRAIDLCRFRLYNPNQQELELAIDYSFKQERARLLGEESMDDLLSPDWLAKQEIYQRIALPKIRNMAEDTAEVMQTKWKKVLRDGGYNNSSRLIAASSIKNITKQLRGVTDTIWPQLLNAANIGYLDQEEREDIIIDLKAQLTEILTSEMMQRMSRHLAEELYFDQEPLVQIEKHVRQLVKDWSEVMLDIRAEQGRRRKRIKTVFLTETKSMGAASGDLQFEPGSPLHVRSEKAYEALKTSLDKRIARKALTIMGKSIRAEQNGAMSIDDLTYAMGRFSTRLTDVLAVFIHAGLILDEPKGDLLPTTKIELVEVSIVEKWTRLSEWVYDKAPGSLEGASLGNTNAGLIGASDATAPKKLDMGLQESFGAIPADLAGLIKRGNQVYESLSPSIRKRVARKVLGQVGKAAQEGGSINSGNLKNNIGRFERMVDELVEYFVRQGILQFSGPEIQFTDPGIVANWDDLKKWMLE